MISSAELLLLAGTLLVPPADTAVDAALAGRVRELVASTWQVAPDRVQLAWSQTARLVDVPSATPLRLTGSGAQGWFGLLVHRADGTPVALRLRAGLVLPQPTAARALDRGAVLGDSDIVMSQGTHWGAPSTAPAVTPPVGWEVRRPVQPGSPLVPPSIAPPLAVRAGGLVRLAWREGNVHLVRETTALATARVGESVRVRAGTDPTPLLAVMTAPGEAILQEVP